MAGPAIAAVQAVATTIILSTMVRSVVVPWSRLQPRLILAGKVASGVMKVSATVQTGAMEVLVGSAMG